MRLNWINAVLAFIATFHTQVEVVDFPVQKLQLFFSVWINDGFNQRFEED